MKPTKTNLTLKSAITAALIFSGSALAMDTRYEDRSGNLVADVPQDESQWVDPNTLIFAYTPVEDPAVYADVWSEFLSHLEKTTEKRFVSSLFKITQLKLKQCVQVVYISQVSTQVQRR